MRTAEEKKLAKREAVRRWQSKNRTHPSLSNKYKREYTLARVCEKVGITVEYYHSLPQTCFNPGCKLNNITLGVHKRMYIDHDHKTGKFRGLLCNNCNVSLGLLKDDIDRISGLLIYLGCNKVNSGP